MKQTSLPRLHACRLFCVLLGLSASGGQAQQVPEHSTIAASFTRAKWFPLPLLHLSLNNQETGTFAFDTGTNGNLLTKGMSQRLGLIAKPIPGANPKQADINQFVNVDRLQFGDSALNNVSCALMEDDLISGMFLQKIDGILGSTFMEPYAVCFDFSHDEISLYSFGGMGQEERKKMGMEGAVALPMMNDSGRGFTVRVKFSQDGSGTKVQGEETLLIDTGAAFTHISRAMARRLKIKTVKKGIEGTTVDGVAREEEGTVDTLILGDLELHNVRVRCPNPTPKDFIPLLGLDVLTQGKALFDCPNKTLYFKLAPSDVKEPKTDK
jgi:predicted aspartyl protease